MSQAFSEKIRDFLKNYLDSGFQNGGSRESGLSVMALSAETAGTFIPLVREISPGLWLEKGRILGKIVSGENLFYAYAQDKGVNRIKPGDKADIKLAAN